MLSLRDSPLLIRKDLDEIVNSLRSSPHRASIPERHPTENTGFGPTVQTLLGRCREAAAGDVTLCYTQLAHVIIHVV